MKKRHILLVILFSITALFSVYTYTQYAKLFELKKSRLERVKLKKLGEEETTMAIARTFFHETGYQITYKKKECNAFRSKKHQTNIESKVDPLLPSNSIKIFAYTNQHEESKIIFCLPSNYKHPLGERLKIADELCRDANNIQSNSPYLENTFLYEIVFVLYVRHFALSLKDVDLFKKKMDEYINECVFEFGVKEELNYSIIKAEKKFKKIFAVFIRFVFGWLFIYGFYALCYSNMSWFYIFIHISIGILLYVWSLYFVVGNYYSNKFYFNYSFHKWNNYGMKMSRKYFLKKTNIQLSYVYTILKYIRITLENNETAESVLAIQYSYLLQGGVYELAFNFDHPLVKFRDITDIATSNDIMMKDFERLFSSFTLKKMMLSFWVLYYLQTKNKFMSKENSHFVKEYETFILKSFKEKLQKYLQSKKNYHYIQSMILLFLSFGSGILIVIQVGKLIYDYYQPENIAQRKKKREEKNKRRLEDDKERKNLLDEIESIREKMFEIFQRINTLTETHQLILEFITKIHKSRVYLKSWSLTALRDALNELKRSEALLNKELKQYIKNEERKEYKKFKDEKRIQDEAEEKQREYEEKQKNKEEKDKRMSQVLKTALEIGFDQHEILIKLQQGEDISDKELFFFEKEVQGVISERESIKEAQTELPILMSKAEELYESLPYSEQRTFSKKMKEYQLDYQKLKHPTKLLKKLTWIIQKMSKLQK